jgi:hypothetical protein
MKAYVQDIQNHKILAEEGVSEISAADTFRVSYDSYPRLMWATFEAAVMWRDILISTAPGIGEHRCSFVIEQHEDCGFAIVCVSHPGT